MLLIFEEYNDGIVFHVYVYSGLPPVAITLVNPVFSPLQSMFTEVSIFAFNFVGCLIVSDAVPVHPFLSVKVILYIPIGNALII